MLKTRQVFLYYLGREKQIFAPESAFELLAEEDGASAHIRPP
jgi:hypothetical protein